MRLFLVLTIITLCLSGCSRKCFMLFDYKCEKVGTSTTSTAASSQPVPLQVAEQPAAVTPITPAENVIVEAPIPLSPCGPEEICNFNVDLYAQWLAQKINATLIEKDYIEQNITISPKCEEVGCLPPPFHNSFEGMLQDNLLFYGVGLRKIEDENSLRLRYQAQVVPIIDGKNNNMSKLVLTTTIIKADKFIFSNTSIFTINKWDAWQYRILPPASVIPITQSLPIQSASQKTATKESKTIIEPQPLTSTNS